MERILIVEDELYLQKNIKALLEKNGYETITASTKTEAMYYILNHREISLYLLDLWLPDGDGFELLRQIHKTSITPVLFLTACDDEESVVKALDLGADDYITKPFRAAELISRIGANLRRKNQKERITLRESGELCLNVSQRRVFKNGRDLELGIIEFQLLSFFMENPGRLVRRETLLHALWEAAGEFAEDNTLSVHMSRLRKKIGQEYIETIRGFGYRFIKPVQERVEL